MRESAKGSGSQKPFEINELRESSHFSPPETSEEQDTKEVDNQETKQSQHRPEGETIAKQQEKKQKHKPEQTNAKTNQKPTNPPIYQQNTHLLSCQQTANSNSSLTIYIVLMYLGVFLYMCDFFILIVPSLRQIGKINRAAQIVLDFVFMLMVLVMMVSYEKARRTAPGYPVGLKELYQVEKVEEVLALEEIEQLKSHTMSLLIKKAELRQALQKDTSLKNLSLFQYLSLHPRYRQFQYRFFVSQTKWCQKCLNIKRPRVRHCSQCNRCIQRMDHHCVWLNNCVGRRNHKFLVISKMILMLFVVVGVVDLANKETAVASYLGVKYGMFCKVVYVIGLLFATGLWFYYTFVLLEQLYLILNNLTFVESLSNVLAEKKPWKRDSYCQNLRQVFGSGCWICPTEVKESAGVLFGQEKNKKNPSVELVEEVLGGNNGQLTNFESENYFRHQRNQI